MKILNLVQGSDEWKQVRKRYVTASEMASVLKIPGAYKSRKKLIEEKLGPEPELTEFQRNLFARGHMAESGLTKDAENMLGMPFQTLVAVDEELGILASIDNINLEYGVIVETKLCGTEKKLGPAREGIVWEPYRVQILTQMLVAKVRIGFMLMLNADTEETHLVSVSRDPAVEKRIVDETALFNKELEKVKNSVDADNALVCNEGTHEEDPTNQR